MHVFDDRFQAESGWNSSSIYIYESYSNIKLQNIS